MEPLLNKHSSDAIGVGTRGASSLTKDSVCTKPWLTVI